MSKKSKIPAILGGISAFDKPVPITEPTIPSISILKKRYEEVLKSRMITNSKCVQELEVQVAKYLGVKHAVAVSSCTSGLMLVMKALELKGEVILPSFTFHATAHAVVWNGLKPVFVDCDSETYNIDPREVERAITLDTSAIIAVHVFGNPPDIDALERIAKKHKVKLIFDAAHGFGTKYKGKNVGGFGDAESFSLSPTKLLTAGEGGMVATNNDELAAKLRIGRNYGDSGDYNPEFSGLSARMSEFNALLGIESLKILEKNVARRDKLVKLYKKLLSSLPGINFQKIEEGNQSSFKDFSILIDGGEFGLSRDKLYDALMAENIVVKKYFYPPLHKQKAFLGFGQKDKNLPNTVKISENALSLPLFSHIPVKTVKKICDAIYKIYKRASEISNVRRN
ncbi:MAG: DegT/DnrJ/EryC1/StrS family aminotransferase [bacterium]